MTGLRLLAFSDLHRDVAVARAIVDAARNVDVVVGAGDFATRGEGASDTLAVLRNLHCPLVLVHGNHDDPDELRRLTADWTDAHLLHGKGVEIGDTTFFGLGGEVPMRNDAVWNAGMSEDEATALLRDCPEGCVLVTHNPPLGHCDVQRDGSHEGSEAILECVRRTRPSHVLCGHIHHAWGMRSTLGRSAVANIGPRPIVVKV